MKKLVILTDLDGTLLDAEDYSFEAARPAQDMIAARGIPLILTASTTRAEIEVLRDQLGNTHPFITENGGGICSIGLGDACNDRPLLQAVDTSVVVMDKDGDFDSRLAGVGALKTRLPGPAGWSDSLLKFLPGGPCPRTPR